MQVQGSKYTRIGLAMTTSTMTTLVRVNAIFGEHNVNSLIRGIECG
jgi:hypothetical protein